jgi:predicted acetyltransferase
MGPEVHVDHTEHGHNGTAPAAPSNDFTGVELVETTAGDRPVVENLAHFCAYDFSELLSRDVGEDGTFGAAVPGLRRGCWEDPRRHTFLLRAAGKLAGSAIVEDHSEPPGAANRWEMGEFFILRRYRGRGVGERAARILFDRFPGRWVVYTLPQNAAAQVFWRTIIDRYTAGQFVAERLDGFGSLGYTWCFCSGGTGREPQREC